MKYIIATEDKFYWRWQILVQIHNFKKLNLDQDLIYVIAFNGKPSQEILKIQKTVNVKMFFIEDERDNKTYAPSIRPHILRKFFKQYPEYGKCFFYTDPDVLLLKPLKMNAQLKNDIQYVSDTRSYLSAEYVMSKGKGLLEEMCSEVDIDVNLVIKNDKEVGGAQYLLKNIDYTFWENVEKDCTKLFILMEKTKHKYMPTFPIQSWTADMWAVLWNLWKIKKETKIIKSMNFAWATDGMSTLENVSILHNAGITNQSDCFNKGHYANKSPFFQDYSKMNKNMASYRYVTEIIETGEKYGQLI